MYCSASATLSMKSSCLMMAMFFPDSWANLGRNEGAIRGFGSPPNLRLQATNLFPSRLPGDGLLRLVRRSRRHAGSSGLVQHLGVLVELFEDGLPVAHRLR